MADTKDLAFYDNQDLVNLPLLAVYSMHALHTMHILLTKDSGGTVSAPFSRNSNHNEAVVIDMPKTASSSLPSNSSGKISDGGGSANPPSNFFKNLAGGDASVHIYNLCFCSPRFLPAILTTLK